MRQVLEVRAGRALLQRTSRVVLAILAMGILLQAPAERGELPRAAGRAVVRARTVMGRVVVVVGAGVSRCIQAVRAQVVV
jgi:hypothetical protein